MTTHTYWNHDGTYQTVADKLFKRIPLEGPVTGKANRELERFRKASNAYYDIFNNGGINRGAQIRATFGIGMRQFRRGTWFPDYDWDRIHKVTEPVMDQLILAAAIEQGILIAMPTPNLRSLTR